MNRIDEKFKELRKLSRKAFIPYITAGDPDMERSKRIILALAEEGADIIEIGIPFSDPLADGPIIQNAIKRSLDAGCTVKKVLKLTSSLRKKTLVPFVFMTYYNIIYHYGIERFVSDAKRSGVDGLIVPDLPMEEAGELRKITLKEGVHLIMLTAPTTPLARFKKIASFSRGFTYHVSLTGVTGVRKNLEGELKKDIKKFKRAAKIPVCVGFGVSNARQAGEIASFADGVIVGSAIIRLIEKNLSNKRQILGKVRAFARGIAKAVHAE